MGHEGLREDPTFILRSSLMKAADARAVLRAVFLRLYASFNADGFDNLLTVVRAEKMLTEQIWLQVDAQIARLLNVVKQTFRSFSGTCEEVEHFFTLEIDSRTVQGKPERSKQEGDPVISKRLRSDSTGHFSRGFCCSISDDYSVEEGEKTNGCLGQDLFSLADLEHFSSNAEAYLQQKDYRYSVDGNRMRTNDPLARDLTLGPIFNGEEILAPGDKNPLSYHQVEQSTAQRLRETMWSLKGEAGSKDRPVNSMLEFDIHFEHASLPAPVVNEELTSFLEDMIKKRISVQHFDDNEHFVPTCQGNSGREELFILDDSKSSKGLSELYSGSYIKARNLKQDVKTSDNAKDSLKQRAQLLLKELYTHLDTLGHFHFIKKHKCEVKSMQAKSSIQMADALADKVNLSGSSVSLNRQNPGARVTEREVGDINTSWESSKEHRRARRLKRKRTNLLPQLNNERSGAVHIKCLKNDGASSSGVVQNSERAAAVNHTKSSNVTSVFSKSTKVFSMIQDYKDVAHS